MGKLLLFILLGALAYLLLKRGQPPKPRHSPSPRPAESMVECARCGVHLPLSESVAEGDQTYCCEEHRRLGRK